MLLSIGLQIFRLGSGFERTRAGRGLFSGCSHYCAGFDTEPDECFDAVILPDTNFLQARGVHVTTVAEIMEPRPLPHEDEGFTPTLEWDATRLELSRRSYRNQDHALEAHSHTVVANAVESKAPFDPLNDYFTANRMWEASVQRIRTKF